MKIFVSATVLAAALGLATAANAAAPRLAVAADLFTVTTSAPGVHEVGYRGGWKHRGHKVRKMGPKGHKPRHKGHKGHKRGHHGYCGVPVKKPVMNGADFN